MINYVSDLTLVEMYVTKELSPRGIVEELEKQGISVSFSKISQRIKTLGVLRSRKDECSRKNRYKTQFVCLFCKKTYVKNSGTQQYCRECVPSTRAARSHAATFGISQQEYDRLLIEQKNACGLCERSFVGLSSRQVVVDHCHKINVVRGVVCARCNLLLAALDTEGWLEKAKVFLKKIAIIPVWERETPQ